MRRVALTLALGLTCLAFGETRSSTGWKLPSGFWDHWGDGQAEIAAYDLVIERYGETRKGTAVAIFVTEPFRVSARVKAEPGDPETDVIQVLKLNLVRDFPTGVYDYNVMTSSFVALEPHGTIEAGGVVKSTFSSQEWCGQVWQEVVPRGNAATIEIRSYFEGEQGSSEVAWSGRTIAADALFQWARGLALPHVEPGGSVTVPVLGSALTRRLQHRDATIRSATLQRSASTSTIRVPAGELEVREATVDDGEEKWSFWIEAAEPHRIVKWSLDGVESAVLIGAKRMPYWKMNGERFRDAVRDLGLSPRPSRTM